MHKKLVVIVMHIIVPILLGACIYILFRKQTLYIFSWIHYINGDSVVNNLRFKTQVIGRILPDWVKYSLPDALWVYSFTFSTCLLWYDYKSNLRYLFLLIGPTVGVIGELAQYIHLVPGTFDAVDLTCCSMAGALPFIVINAQREKYF